MKPECRIVEGGQVTRYGEGWSFTYPVGAMVSVEIDDTPIVPIRAWTRSAEREAEPG